MSNLNRAQFKIDYGPEHNERLDMAEESRAPYKYRQAAGQAEPGYYRQPSSNVRQMALPGMEMSVHDHLSALAKATGNHYAYIDSGKISHRMAVLAPDPDRPGSSGSEVGHLSWDNKRGVEGQKDTGTDFEPQYHPGEIRMVRSHKPGVASAMLETAERLAMEHGYPFPKHSHDRTSEGVPWSQRQMKKRGEKVW